MIRLLSPGILLAAAGFATAGPPGTLEYNRDVRPILAETCFACHGPDSAARKAGLRLDQREAALAKDAFVPGKPAESELVERLFRADDDDTRMPPPKSHKALKPAQKEILKQWVAQGAVYQPHWSFIPPTRPAVPTITAAVRNPIDNFIHAELAKKNLAMAPEADRRTLARRLSLDLTGLPPAPADVEAFVADKAANYYEAYVDKLMATPQWGEHRGRYWLDAARYADTHGIHFDNFREMWSYRDWVVSAFNANQKFDAFTVEQLAGDLFPNATVEQKIATGFNRCNITTNEGGAISEEYLVLYTRDRTETASQVWMGLTTGCAVCHDHKFDPISQKEFYGLAAFFNNTTQAAMDGNIHDTPPIIQVPTVADRPRHEQVKLALAAAKAKVIDRKKAARPDFTKWAAAVKPADATEAVPADKIQFQAGFRDGTGQGFAASVGGKPRTVTGGNFNWVPGKTGKALNLAGIQAEIADVGDFDTKDSFTVSAWVKFPKAGTNGAIVARMDAADKGHRGWDLWAQNDRVAMHVLNTWPTDAVKVVAKTPLKANEWHHITATYDGTAKAAGVKIYINGVVQATDVEADNLKGTTRTTVPFRLGRRQGNEGANAVVVQDLRIDARALTGPEAGRLAKSTHVADLLAKADKRTPKETEELFDYYIATLDAPTLAAEGETAKLAAEEAAIRGRGTIAHVMNEKPVMAEAFILNRGDYDKRKEKVAAFTPKVLPTYPADLPKNRLGFAKWLLTPTHPLTGRVTVNRFWQELFGTGIVKTSGDFGVTGDAPTHPELLDWLAMEFATDWDVKRFFKLMVTSATYRQSAAATKEKIEKDPANRLMSRGPRFRMDAEMIRDYALAASGLMVPKFGGPSVRPYQPEGVWEAVAMPGSNTRDYKVDAGDKLYRRSLYTFWKRAAPPASMEVLNAPNRETCAVRRERTNTPLQALLTLNDVQYVEAARVLAAKTMQTAADDAKRLDFLAKVLLSRPFSAAETTVVTASLADLRAEFKAKPAEAKKLVTFGESKPDAKLDAIELATWTMLANELFNLDEVLNK